MKEFLRQLYWRTISFLVIMGLIWFGWNEKARKEYVEIFNQSMKEW